MIKFLEYEKNINSKRINFRPDSDLEKKISSESYNLLKINSFWLRKKDTHCFFTDSGLLNYFLHEDKVLFLIHPASENYFKDLVPLEPGPIFKGYTTSSPRTILIYNEDLNIIFFGKLSLDRFIGVNRTLPKGEISRSIGTTKILDKLKKEGKLHKNFSYFREILGVIPKNYERGGMIIRETHQDMFDEKIQLYPAFALYTEKHLFYSLFKKKLNRSDYFLQYISNKFIDVYIHLYKLGISTEPHGQNLIIKIKGGKLSFIFRDFGGFNINLEKYPNIEVPFIENIREEYHQDKHEISLCESLSYFNVGIMMEISHIDPVFRNKCNHYSQIKKSIKKYCKKYKLDTNIFLNFVKSIE